MRYNPPSLAMLDDAINLAAQKAVDHFALPDGAHPPPRTAGNPPFLLTPIRTGLINRTFLVQWNGQQAILQRLNPLFSREIHRNIQAVSQHLAAQGLVTPQLLPTRDQQLDVDLGPHGLWRLLSFVPGETLDRLRNPGMAASAGELLGRWHRACVSLQHVFVARRRAHDTPLHFATLQETLQACQDHPYFASVHSIAHEITQRAARLEPLPAVALPTVHGDPKVNNLRFVDEQAACLIDLDTVGPGELGHELGDAWRSWCNTLAEDDPAASFDLALHEAALSGYRRGWQRPLDPAQQKAALLGVEWIALELSARFANDVLRERYFAWDSRRFARASDHHLARAQAQLNLHRSAHDQRAARQRALQ